MTTPRHRVSPSVWKSICIEKYNGQTPTAETITPPKTPEDKAYWCPPGGGLVDVSKWRFFFDYSDGSHSCETVGDFVSAKDDGSEYWDELGGKRCFSCRNTILRQSFPGDVKEGFATGLKVGMKMGDIVIMAGQIFITVLFVKAAWLGTKALEKYLSQ